MLEMVSELFNKNDYLNTWWGRLAENVFDFFTSKARILYDLNLINTLLIQQR